jgi:capsular exopolysaccharide synthesis family protein
MDKLEKALEKARRERESNVVNSFEANSTRFKKAYTAPTPSNLNAIEIEESLLEKNCILAHRPRSAEADVFRILRTQVLQIMNKTECRTLAITSPRYADGKSTTALNLALSIALDLKQTVLIIDLDLRKPTLEKFLGLKNVMGITDHLVHNMPISECLVRLPFERLSILPGGNSLDNSSELLGSPQMARLANELKVRYHDRLIIYDMPPVLEQDDSIAFLPHVDATLVVVRDGVTTEDDLRTTLERLSGSNVIGTVLNNSAQ